MFCKTCTCCGNDSYSASSGNGEWKCPHCGKDLANETAEPASAKDEANNDKCNPR